METLLSAARNFLHNKGWKTQRKGSCLRTYIRGEHAHWLLQVVTNEDDRWVVARSIVGFEVPEAMRARVATYLAHVNYGMILGSVEIDMDDGEVAVKTSLRLTHDAITPAMLEDLFMANFVSMDNILPGLMAVVYGGRSVQKALAMHPWRPQADAASEGGLSEETATDPAEQDEE